MFLVKLIDVFVGIIRFLFTGDRRNNSGTPLALGALGIVVLLVGLFGALAIPRIWYTSNTHSYSAEMVNASGLSGGDPVYVAGVPAGRVEAVRLVEDHVVVDFRLDKGQPLGNRTTATVRLKTVLGKRYLEVVPGGVAGEGENLIPLARTTVPYSLDDVSRDATTTAQGIDVDAMQEMMTTLTQVLPADSEELGKALAGISGASEAFAQNGEQVDHLLVMSRQLSDMVAKQEDSLVGTLGSAQTVVSILAVRKQALTDMADRLSAILATLAASFTENDEKFSQLVTNLTAVTGTLKDSAASIDGVLARLPSALRSATDATGNGPWTDVTAPSAIIPDNLLCFVGVMQGCK
ncbi:MCE family protein [Tomitella biformata]|uniref:MCE family protein n=1 Tax=Tomitella biformata TaxID=630403 RepID=UPI0004634F50|nr:MlaD family protein [Tomitella biformata]